MKIIVVSEDAIRVEPVSAQLTIEAGSGDKEYGPFHMLASGLGMCSLAVLHSWAEHAHLAADDLAVEVHWHFAEDPHRVSDIGILIDWLSLPPVRFEAARRVTEQCGVHATLRNSPAITVTVREAASPLR